MIYMLQNEKVDHENKKLNRNVYNVHAFVMKYLFKNQNLYKSKLLLFRKFNFLNKDIYVNKAKLWIFKIFY